ncbi:hypothetical protein ACSDQ9_09295 [Aestuariimicrobium soli]|uniref:hypothetical protein n=1 Tax=Aestuariimicrobium soli TaxID=2035834 RepID=UPI003EBB3F83
MPPQQLIVRSVYPPLRRRFRLLTTVHASMAAICLAAMLAILMLAPKVVHAAAWVFVLLLVNSVFQLAYYCWYWGARLAIGRPLVVDDTGLEFQSTAGQIRLPWPAVDRVERVTTIFGQQVMKVHIRPGATPGQGGVEAEARIWRKLVKSGVQLGSVGIEPGLDVVLAAIAHHSRGQVRLG